MGESPTQVGAASLAHDLLKHAAAVGAFVTSWIVMMSAMMGMSERAPSYADTLSRG